MRLPLPGPDAVVQPVRALAAAMQTCGSAVATMTELVPQIEQAVTRTISLLDDAERSVPRVGMLLDEMEDLVGSLRTIRADTVAALTEHLDSLLTSERAVTAGELLDRLDAILTPDRVEAAQALLDRLPVLFDAERTRALSALADQAQRLVTLLEAGELPVSRELQQMPRDIHATLEVLDDLRQVVTGLPGAGRAHDRGAMLTHA
jgi:hypothetical protein